MNEKYERETAETDSPDPGEDFVDADRRHEIDEKRESEDRKYRRSDLEPIQVFRPGFCSDFGGI